MVRKNLGKASLTPRGTYDPTASYTRLDIVEHDGSSYIVLKDVVGVTPSDGDSYMLLASKGNKGDTPVKGVDYYTEAEKEEIVKEAVEGVQAAEKQYELIEEITLDEAVASFTRNMDTNGKPYNLSAIRVRVNAPAAEGATSSSQIIFQTQNATGGSPIYHQVTGGLGTSARATYLVARNECGLVDYYTVNSAVNNSGARYMRDGYVIRPWTNIASLIISTYPTSVLIPAGTTITIYGIKEATNES